MKIAKMAKLSGAGRYGSCAECNKSVSNDADALKITLESSISIMLCERCWKKLTHILDEIDFNDVLKTLKKQENADE